MKLPWSKDASSAPDAVSESQERFWAQDIEVPRADLEGIQRNQRKQAFRRGVVYVTMAAGIFGLAGGCNASNRMDAFEEKQANQQVASAGQDSAGRFAATQAIEQWLDSSPSPLPGGRLLNWTGATQLSSQTKDSNGNETDRAVHRELNTFTVVDGVGRGYSASVLVAYTDDGQVSVLSDPSIIPRVISSNSDFAGGEFWPGLDASPISDSGQTAVQTWADAYTSGNASELRQVVGDPDASHIYVPISGITSTSVKVEASAKVKEGVIAQVTVTSKWSGRKYQDNADAKPAVYDVLIKGADTAAPRVVAWGPPGSGPTLKPYSNAIVLSKAAVDNGEGNTSSSTPTDASPSPSSTSPKTGEGVAPTSAPTKNSSSSSSSSSTSSSSSSASSTSSK